MNAIPTVVYIVDDDPEVRRALARLLRAASYTTRSFGSASEFLVSSEARLCAGCIILDLAMPGLNGLELQQCLTASGCHRPIIFLTGNGDISKTVRAMKAGAVNFLTKPVDDREQRWHEGLDVGRVERGHDHPALPSPGVAFRGEDAVDTQFPRDRFDRVPARRPRE